MTTQDRIRARCAEIAEFLVEKNKSYGDSALYPVGIFAKGDAVESLSARLDDKLARLKFSPGAYGEDTIKDMIGYLVFLTLALEDRTRVTEERSREVLESKSCSATHRVSGVEDRRRPRGHR